jgi:hypothetical protein
VTTPASRTWSRKRRYAHVRTHKSPTTAKGRRGPGYFASSANYHRQTPQRAVPPRSEFASATPGCKAWRTWTYKKASQNWLLRGGTLQDDGIGGSLGLQAVVGTKTQTALLDEIIAPPCFVLLGRDSDPADRLSPPVRAAWQRLGGRSAHFGPGGLADTEGKYAPWFERLNASVVVIRPDFQVFGGVLDPSTTDGLVDNLAERVLANGCPGMPTSGRSEASSAKA